MKVLFLAPAPPWPPDSGGRVRTYELLRALRASPEVPEVHLVAVDAPGRPPQAERALGAVCASVALLPRGSPPPWARLARAKRERWFHSPALAAHVAARLRGERFDLVHFDELALARSAPAALEGPRALHHHKLDVGLAAAFARTPAARVDLARLRALEAEAARRFPFQLTCCEEDAARLRARFPWLETAAVPSGVDPERFRPRDGPRARDLLLFLGTLDYAPNVDAAEHLVRDVLPLVRRARPEVALALVGRDPGPRVRALTGAGVELVGAVDDVRPHLARAALLVAPLRIGGGTRLKLVEALSMECPVVATPVAAEGLALAHERELLLAEGAAELAAAVLALLEAPERARALARAGRAAVRARYSWSRLGASLLEAWRLAAASTAR